MIDARTGDPVEVAGSLRSALANTHGQVRAAASRSAPVGSLRRTFHEARCALEATALADGDAPEVASHQDLGAFTLLLSLQDEDALRLYSDGLLEPIELTEGEYDHIPEQAFFLCGGIEDVEANAKKLEG